MAKSFVMVVEETPPIEATIKCDDASVPDIVIYRDEYFVRIGRYLSPGDRYRFRRPFILNADME